MDKHNIKLIIQFDGTDFHGWQEQSGQRTVQSVLKQAIKRLCGEEPVIFSSSRTDAGVHAIAMPVNFLTSCNLPLRAYTLGLNSILPPDIKVLSAEEQDYNFNARFCATQKTYLYRIHNNRVPSPLERRTSWHIPVPLDITAMKKGGEILIGEHDFSAFRASGCNAKSSIKKVFSLEIFKKHDHIIEIEISADGFLRNMVRIIVGSLVEVGLGKHDPEWIQRVLEGKDRRLAGQTAPPQGLFLKKVEY